jgi:hypothetical protein
VSGVEHLGKAYGDAWRRQRADDETKRLLATYLAAIRELLEALEASPDDMDIYEYETIVDGAKAQARWLLKRAEPSSN